MNVIKFKPLGDRVLVENLIEEGEKNKGGIIIPEASHVPELVAKIIALGTQVDEDLAIGQEVLLPTYGGQALTANGRKYMIVEVKDLLGVLT